MPVHAETPLPSTALLEPSPAATVSPEPPKQLKIPTTPSTSAKDRFKEALSNAYQNNPALKAARKELAAINEGVAQAVSEFRPTIVGGYATGRQRRSVGDASWDYTSTTSKTLDIDQPVFSGGTSWAHFKSAKDRMQAGRAQLLDNEQQVLLNAIITYTDVVEKQDVLHLNQHNVDILKQHAEITRARFDAGTVTQTDIAQSEARLAQAQADERQALGNLEVASASFKRIIGYAPEGELALPPVPDHLPPAMNDAIVAAQAANPALIAAQHTESAAASDIEARTGAMLPDVSIHGSLDRNTNGRIPGISKLDNDALTLNVSIPLYQSGAEWSRLREARNLADRAKYTTIDTKDAVLETVTRTWQDYMTAKAVIISTTQAAEAAEIALKGVRQENQFGVRTTLDVLDAEQEAFSTRVNLVKAERLEKLHAYRLLAATGGLTAKNMQLAVDVYDPKEHYDEVKYQLLGW